MTTSQTEKDEQRAQLEAMLANLDKAEAHFDATPLLQDSPLPLQKLFEAVKTDDAAGVRLALAEGADPLSEVRIRENGFAICINAVDAYFSGHSNEDLAQEQKRLSIAVLEAFLDHYDESSKSQLFGHRTEMARMANIYPTFFASALSYLPTNSDEILECLIQNGYNFSAEDIVQTVAPESDFDLDETNTFNMKAEYTMGPLWDRIWNNLDEDERNKLKTSPVLGSIYALQGKNGAVDPEMLSRAKWLIQHGVSGQTIGEFDIPDANNHFAKINKPAFDMMRPDVKQELEAFEASLSNTTKPTAPSSSRRRGLR